MLSLLSSKFVTDVFCFQAAKVQRKTISETKKMQILTFYLSKKNRSFFLSGSLLIFNKLAINYKTSYSCIVKE